jgi:hypothetical protein
MATPMTLSPQAQQQTPINAWDLALLKAQSDALAQYPMLASTNPALAQAKPQQGSTPNISAISNLFKGGGPSGVGDMADYNSFGAVDATGSSDIAAGSADAAAEMSGAAGGEAATGSVLGADAAGTAGLGAMGTAGIAAMPLLAVMFGSLLDKGQLPWEHKGEVDPRTLPGFQQNVDAWTKLYGSRGTPTPPSDGSGGN